MAPQDIQIILRKLNSENIPRYTLLEIFKHISLELKIRTFYSINMHPHYLTRLYFYTFQIQTKNKQSMLMYAYIIH